MEQVAKFYKGRQNMTSQDRKEIVITRIFNAPRELVWKAWTEPEMIKKWWGPKDFTAPEIKVDLRKGGKYLYCMRSPEGNEYWSGGTFQEIVPFEKMVLTDSFSDEKGNMVEPVKYGMSKDFPKEMQVTIKFEEYPQNGGGKTKLTIAYAKPESDASYEAIVKSGMESGWNESLDKLAESLMTQVAETLAGKTR
ncbi:MAG: hypothetical protein A2539_08700 [Elusimicrobia bacterium RIFOXYD2_FULL_34_15]|nr:MAG: hypothetical protein A2539_08700 [Elusimicrobia bacterium RIFOXYD2_FULL_34_15]